MPIEQYPFKGDKGEPDESRGAEGAHSEHLPAGLFPISEQKIIELAKRSPYAPDLLRYLAEAEARDLQTAQWQHSEAQKEDLRYFRKVSLGTSQGDPGQASKLDDSLVRTRNRIVVLEDKVRFLETLAETVETELRLKEGGSSKDVEYASPDPREIFSGEEYTELESLSNAPNKKEKIRSMLQRANADLEDDELMAIAEKNEAVRELGRLLNRGEAEEKIMEKVAAVTERKNFRDTALEKTRARARYLEKLMV